MLTLVAATGRITALRVLPAANALVSWTTAEAVDTIELIVDTTAGRRSRALPYAAFEPGRRSSLGGFDEVARIETDIVRAGVAIAAIEVHAHKPLRTVAASTRGDDAPRSGAPLLAEAQHELDVPEHTQYLTAYPAERGWCAPASLAMLLGAHGIGADVDEVAAGVFDHAYGGTGNWSFAIAYAGMCGLTGAAAYLRDLRTLELFIAAGLPVAASIAWEPGALPGAPLDRSAGHILVVRGFTATGDVIVNDPAQPAVRHVYDRTAFATCWLAHGGVALLVAPPARSDDLMRCANA